MIASVYTQYGPPEVLQLKEVTMPIPKKRGIGNKSCNHCQQNRQQIWRG